jgi:hypothetical protein
MDILLLEYWSVSFPFAGKKEILHFSDTPYCVAISLHTSIGLSHMEMCDFRMCFVLKVKLPL